MSREPVNVSLRDVEIVHRAGPFTAIVAGEAIVPVRTACGRSIGTLARGVVQRGPRLSCPACAREVYGKRVDLADLAAHGLYDGPLR